MNTSMITYASRLLRRVSGKSCRPALGGVHSLDLARRAVKHDEPGRALIDATNAYLRAIQPTAQLTHNLIDALARIVAQRTGEEVRIQIGKAPAFFRAPAIKRSA